MAQRLQPDLERIGDQLEAAAERAAAASRRRRALARRTAATGVAAVLAGAALAPGALAPAERAAGSSLLAGVTSTHGLPVACDQPRGRAATPAVCAAGEPVPLGRPRRW